MSTTEAKPGDGAFQPARRDLAKIALGGLGVFGELRWNELSTNVADTSFDVDLNGIGANVGVILGGGK